jgi:stress response protein SCP2
MGEYGVQAGSTIQLVKILQTLSQSIEHVIFDLTWGFPRNDNSDFLDASALLYDGDAFQEHVDFRNKRSRAGRGAVTHSGRCITDALTNRGRHRMKVSLTDLPSYIDKVFFTLSSWQSPSIASYKKPSLQFYDVTCPDRQLCSEEFDRAINSEAVIMCSVCRVNGRWKVFSLGAPSSGNVMRERYCYLQATIEDIIGRGIC